MSDTPAPTMTPAQGAQRAAELINDPRADAMKVSPQVYDAWLADYRAATAASRATPPSILPVDLPKSVTLGPVVFEQSPLPRPELDQAAPGHEWSEEALAPLFAEARAAGIPSGVDVLTINTLNHELLIGATYTPERGLETLTQQHGAVAAEQMIDDAKRMRAKMPNARKWLTQTRLLNNPTAIKSFADCWRTRKEP
jgi:hypothetical protein